MYERAACGLVLAETSGLIRSANATFCTWLGYAPETLLGKVRFQDLFTMGGKVFHQTHLAPLLQMQGSVAEVQLDLRHANGSKLPMLINMVRSREGDSAFDEIAVFVATDRRKYEHELLAARKNAEQSLAALAATQQQLQESRDALARADLKKDEFLATLAHELRNPLAPLQNVLEILRMKSLDDPQLVWARDVFGRQMEHMSRLVDDLMEISRITQGRVELRRQRVDLGDAMRAAAEAARTLVDASGHRLELDPPAAPALLDADPTRLVQILTNLLNNAAKYTPDGGHIWFSARVEGDSVSIAVRDSGIGIASDNLANVFTMFAQLEPGLERAQGGLGIGLALVKGLVELHGGSIRAHSAGVGMGSEFTVRLPLAGAGAQDAAVQEAAAQDAAVQDAAVPAPGAGRRIMVVDDNRDAADMLRMALDMLGHEVSCAYDGAAALALGAELHPDVLILDIGLPDMDGYTLASKVRALPWGRSATLIAATGWGQQRDKERATDAGFDIHMVKPIDFATLDTVLKGLRGSAPKQQ